MTSSKNTVKFLFEIILTGTFIFLSIFAHEYSSIISPGSLEIDPRTGRLLRAELSSTLFLFSTVLLLITALAAAHFNRSRIFFSNLSLAMPVLIMSSIYFFAKNSGEMDINFHALFSPHTPEALLFLLPAATILSILVISLREERGVLTWHGGINMFVILSLFTAALFLSSGLPRDRSFKSLATPPSLEKVLMHFSFFPVKEQLRSFGTGDSINSLLLTPFPSMLLYLLTVCALFLKYRGKSRGYGKCYSLSCLLVLLAASSALNTLHSMKINNYPQDAPAFSETVEMASLLPGLLTDIATGTSALSLSISLAAILTVLFFYSSIWGRAFIDELTGLRNRRALDEFLLRLPSNYSLAMIDIDHFKKFNDTHGHSAGDEVLRFVASRLGHLPTGSAFRYGGEEFTVIYPGVPVNEASRELEAFRSELENTPLTLSSSKSTRKCPRKVSITVSIGLASPSEANPTPELVVEAADKALYRAKKAGRNRIEIEKRSKKR